MIQPIGSEKPSGTALLDQGLHERIPRRLGKMETVPCGLVFCLSLRVQVPHNHTPKAPNPGGSAELEPLFTPNPKMNGQKEKSPLH